MAPNDHVRAITLATALALAPWLVHGAEQGGKGSTPKPENAAPATAAPDNTRSTPQSNAAQASSPQDNAGKPAAEAGKSVTPQKKASTYYNADGELMTGKLVGATIFNDQKQQIGSISDVLLDKSGKAVTAVLSVGGFLGVGSRLVAVPFARLDIKPDRIEVPGATKVSLENLPAYNPNSG